MLGDITMAAGPAFSLVIAVMDEEDNVVPLVAEIAAALAPRDPKTWEVVFVDDGSRDRTVDLLLAQRGVLPNLRVLAHGANCGKSTALRTGIRAARHPIVVTMDGDLQNDPADIDVMLAPFAAGDQNLGLVAGQRIKREDTWSKRIASRLANRLRRRLLNDQARDSVCGWKAMRRDLYLTFPYFDNMHRFFIALAIREGFQVKLVDVKDRRRVHGRSKYTNWGRLLVGVPDLMGMIWLVRRAPGRPQTREL
jgi:dolichol-phosphate mannosyltransferase